VTIEVVFLSPDGERINVGGFFYGSSKEQKPEIKELTSKTGRKATLAVWPCDPADLWKVRYVPHELGDWKYSFTFRNTRGKEAKGEGTFRVVTGRIKRKGWIRINRSQHSKYRLFYADRQIYYWQRGRQEKL